MPSGNWNSGSTWDCGSPPSSSNCPDTIFIDQAVVVNISVTLTSCGPIVFIVNSTLTFQTGKKLYLPANSSIIVNTGGLIVPGGGGGSSNIIEIGGTTVWTTGSGSLGPGTVLDIELLDFFAQIEKNSIELNWSTASETNNDYFTIEHSNDGENFTSIGQIDGARNSSNIINYKFEHLYPGFGINYYRLKQTDFDGQFSYTYTISVNYTNSTYQYIHPNPASDYFIVTTTYSKEVVISNSANRQVLILIDYTGQKIEIQHLPPGLYFVSFKKNNVLKTEKLIIN